jgi:hypothetical protein
MFYSYTKNSHRIFSTRLTQRLRQLIVYELPAVVVRIALEHRMLLYEAYAK